MNEEIKDIEEQEVLEKRLNEHLIRQGYTKVYTIQIRGNLSDHKIIIAMDVKNRTPIVYELVLKDDTEAILNAKESLAKAIRYLNTEGIVGFDKPAEGFIIPAYVVIPDKDPIQVFDGKVWPEQFNKF